MAGEIIPDKITTILIELYKLEVYFVELNQVLLSTTNRFEGAWDILKDLPLITFDRLKVTNIRVKIFRWRLQLS